MLLPHSTTFTAPGLDNPHAYIVATFTSWGTNWAWEVQYHLKTDSWYEQHRVTTSYNTPLTHSILNLRN